MKNIHLLYTDKPSRLFYLASNLHLEEGQLISPKNYQNIYITSDEEIKEGDWVYHCASNKLFKYDGRGLCVEVEKIILTTDQNLIKEGVQAIDDEFLEWFVKNPSCEEVEVEKEQYHTFVGMKKYPMIPNYKIIIPKEEAKKKHIVMLVGDKVNEEQTKCYCGHTTYCDCGPEEPKQETLEEAAERLYPTDYGIKSKDIINIIKQDTFINGAKWQKERMYSEEEVLEFTQTIIQQYKFGNTNIEQLDLLKETLELFKNK
jgi:hypothetical protein